MAPLPMNPTVAALRAEAAASSEATVAARYDFASWEDLVAHVTAVEPFAWDPTRPIPEGESATATMIRRACLDYGHWQLGHLAEARRMLDTDPELAHTSIHAAAAVGDVTAVQTMLAADRTLANAPGGPFPWPPLLYAAYSRLPPAGAHSTLEVARVLLAADADPNAGWLWCGNIPPFTALTGAFGDGENGNNYPPHPERDALARALLDAGADPNDEQTLYNRHFRPDDGHLELLFAYGLGTDKGGPWLARYPRMSRPVDMLVEELWCAARKNYRARVELLLAHGAPPDVPGRRDGKTPVEGALAYGNVAIADLLVARGAKRPVLTPAQDFATACLAGDGDAARAWLARDPSLRGDAHTRSELLRRAVEANHSDAIRLMVDLGFELAVPGHSTPLHEAAWFGNLELVRLLVELGASTTARDPQFDATPLGWAEHNHQQAVVELLSRYR